MNIRYRRRNSLVNWATISFWRRTLLHQISFALKPIVINNNCDYSFGRFASITVTPKHTFLVPFILRNFFCFGETVSGCTVSPKKCNSPARETLRATLQWRWAGKACSVCDLLRAGRSEDRIPSRRHFSHTARSTLGPTQPPIQWLPVLFPGGKVVEAWCWTIIPI